ncbi:MAG TPA: hypothetical protein VH590_01085 [Ktedonobacterales bacterium]|jgi:hypothetical protein
MTMPTYDVEDSFWRDWARLTKEEQRLFQLARRKLVHDLKQGKGIRGARQGLRIKGVQKRKDVWEMTWADDGRATFQLGASADPGDAHVIWRRIGGHEILDNP